MVCGLSAGANGIRTVGPAWERVVVSGRNRNDRIGEEDDLERVVCYGTGSSKLVSSANESVSTGPAE